MATQDLIDISPVIEESSPVFPGDVPYRRQISSDWPESNYALSSIETTLHMGAHADAPIHYHAEGIGIDQVDLSRYIGPCQVIDASKFGSRRLPLDSLHQINIDAPRILFKTNTFDHSMAFQNEFASIEPNLIDALSEKGVLLVGIDTPSVDPADSKELPSHKALYRHKMSVLENLELGHVEPGCYELFALPLRLKGADASPVRAVLRRN